MSLLDDLNAGGGWRMPGATKWRRLRAKRKTNPYNPAQNEPDWSVPPDELAIMGALASSSSMRTPDTLDTQTASTAYLTIPDPTATSESVIGSAQTPTTALVGSRRIPLEGCERVHGVASDLGMPSDGKKGLTMAKSRISVDFNPKFFDGILNSAGVKALTTLAADRHSPTRRRPLQSIPARTATALESRRLKGSTERPSWSSATTLRPCSWRRRPAIWPRR